MKSLSLKYMDRKIAAHIGLVIFIQQLLSSLGIYVFAKAGLSISNPKIFLGWLAAGLVLHLATPVLGFWIRPLETRLGFVAYQNFLKEKLMTKMGMPSLWQQKSSKELFLNSIGSEAESYLSAILFVGLDLFSYVLSLVFGVCILGSVIDVSFVPAFALSGAFSYVAYRALEKLVVQASEEDQEARSFFASLLLQSWENIFFKNENILRQYRSEFEKGSSGVLQKSLKSVVCSEGLVIALCTISALPVMAAILWTVFKNPVNVMTLTALLATVPKQLNLLSTFRSLFQAVSSFISFESKLKTLVTNADLSESSLKDRIQWDQIQIESEFLEPIRSESGLKSQIRSESENAEVQSLINGLGSGRYVIRGKNGAGKSTLLLHLNQTLQSSFYLPSNPLFLQIKEMEGQSTGQKLLSHLQSAIDSEASVILLDEWDANLDAENRAQVNGLLASLKRNKVILEVRHRLEA